MKLKATTKLQYNNRHFSTTFPGIFANAIDAHAGDIVSWEFTTKNDEPVITIKLIKTE
ncbi:MAG: hypothetical protein KO253_04535 [Methanobrevibacter arboriphilus]|nr:hypothetical protein [Methanobrevibacter arboriphilus]